MNRKEFLKIFGIATAAIVVAPTVIAEIVKPEPVTEITPDTIAKARRKGFNYLNHGHQQREMIFYTGEKGRKEFEKSIEAFVKEQEYNMWFK